MIIIEASHYPTVFKKYDYVFIYLMIDLMIDYLKTDYMQFGFNTNHSTVLGTAVLLRLLIITGMRVVMFIAVLLTQVKRLTW